MFRPTAVLAVVLAACVGSYAASGAIWDPKITSPTAGIVDTSDAPSTISEASKVVLAKGGVQDAANPLAQGFDLRAGQVSVTVPASTAPGADYQIVLFGDSGNLSPDFIIA
ncbi:hypothetical protein PHLGIDRAFT_11430 [Phlebiopsis gigantea 11061_1 CR5-6]|uniref:IPT/TIG domain-containing protein n=1 Tax=Phlebiopsis gigantea (strain 11061_1 CR5-6) TaxID=745531 RepID=A0A0C3SE35_PHLG1|nr:hypothetical protein PHLGIDRAFT_11430 [Phlebiopsis gigantea 11061_1 CR5-6]